MWHEQRKEASSGGELKDEVGSYGEEGRPTERTYNETARVKPIALQDKEVIVSI